MIFFTADTHFGHANIIKHCSRPFSHVAEMDESLLAAINAAVGVGDTLWILGDFAYRGRDPAYYRRRINCEKVHLLVGNHDKRSKCELAGFESVGDVSEISVGKQRIWMSHYAHRSWPASHRGSWHLYGHSHGSLHADDLMSRLAALDVGVDNQNQRVPSPWSPWSMDDVARALCGERHG